MIYEFFRLLGVFLGYPLQLLFFKRKTLWEDKKATKLHKGGKLIISNHFNMFDYVLGCFVVFPRKLNAVAGEHAFRSRFFRFGMKFFGTVEANRETRSMKFIDQSVDIINMQIYPEGRNTPDGKIHEFKHSYLVIAYRAGCPIVPIVTDGNYGIFKRTRVYVGKEIDVSPYFEESRAEGRRTPPRADLERANEYVFAKVLELRRLLEEDKAKKGGKSDAAGN